MFLIFDTVDQDYHTGNGDWNVEKSLAQRYETRTEAEAGLDDVDCDEIMRDRLIIVDAT